MAGAAAISGVARGEVAVGGVVGAVEAVAEGPGGEVENHTRLG